MICFFIGFFFPLLQVAKEENINIIFAVTQPQASVYQQLSQVIEGSSSGILTGDSSNIVDLVKSEYSVSQIPELVHINIISTSVQYYMNKCSILHEQVFNII